MFERQINPSSIFCLLIAVVGGIFVFSLKEPQEGVIDFPIAEGDSIGIYHNSEGLLEWEQIRDPSSEKYLVPAPTHNELSTSLMKGSSGSLYTWIRIPLENPGNEVQHLCLEVGTKWIDLARLYVPKKNGNYALLETGESIPYAKRAIPARRPAFRIALEPHSQAIYYLFLEEQNHVFVPIIKLWDSIENFNCMLLTEDRRISFHFSLYCSIFLFSVIAYLVIRSRDLLYYLIYIFIAGITQVNMFNLQSFLYPFTLVDSVWFSDSFFTIQALTSGTFVLFTLEFLDTSKHIPRSDKVIRWFVWIYICIMPILTLGILETPPFIEFALVLYGGIVLTLVCFLIAIARIWQKSYQAYFYVLAYLIYTVCHYRLFFTSIAQIEPPNSMVIQWLYGFTLEMMVLTVALGDRFLSIRKAKEQAQQKAYAEAMALNKLQQSYTELLYREVEEQTTELRFANKRKDELFQIVGDNLRTPLQEVTDLSDHIFLLSESDNFFRRKIQNVWLISFNLLIHLENLLQWARLKVEALPFNPREYTLEDIINPVLRKYQSFMQENQITVCRKMEPPLWVHADWDAMTMIFKNLITYTIVDKKNSSFLNISAFIRNAHVCIKIEHTLCDKDIDREKDHNSKGHFSIQICQQLLDFHNSQLIHQITNNSNLFEFELKKLQT